MAKRQPVLAAVVAVVATAAMAAILSAPVANADGFQAVADTPAPSYIVQDSTTLDMGQSTTLSVTCASGDALDVLVGPPLVDPDYIAVGPIRRDRATATVDVVWNEPYLRTVNLYAWCRDIG